MFWVHFDIPGGLPEVRYAWSLCAEHFGWKWSEAKADTDGADLRIAVEDGDIQISAHFMARLEANDFSHRDCFAEEPAFRTEAGAIDELGTAFYMVNSLQEHSSDDVDQYGRFRYEASYQHRFGNIESDLVSGYFESLRDRVAVLRGLSIVEVPRRVFLSHDIDRIKFGILSEGNFAVRNRDLRRAATVAWKATRGRSEWANAAEVIALHQRYDARSTFLWLPRSGTSHNGIVNADYELSDRQVQREIDAVKAAGFGLGVHKSAYGSTFDEELAMLPYPCAINRNHYLCMQLPDHYERVHNSGLKVDSTLGFSERMGYRNSYSRPFRPFDMKRRRAYDFLEVPLNMMDKSIFDSMKLSGDEASQAALAFLDAAPEGSVTAILWHNNTLTKHRFRERLLTYEALLEFVQSKKIPSLMPTDFEVILGKSLGGSMG